MDRGVRHAPVRGVAVRGGMGGAVLGGATNCTIDSSPKGGTVTVGEYPSRSFIRGLLAGLVDGTLDPEKVSDWAFEFLGEDSSTDYDECVQRGLEHLAVAEPIPVEHGGPLYTRLDHIDWLDEFDRCAASREPPEIP